MTRDDASATLPPQNLEAEESLFSAILLHEEVLNDIMDILSPEDFYRTAHQKIFAAAPGSG